MEEKKEIILAQSNALTNSRYDFSKIEKNVIYHIIRKVRQDMVNDDPADTYEVWYS